MSFTKHHYEIIAQAINKSLERENNKRVGIKLSLITVLSGFFQLDNKGFKPDVFEEMCLKEGVKQ